jgi:hypothetical protein
MAMGDQEADREHQGLGRLEDQGRGGMAGRRRRARVKTLFALGMGW